ncbi:MAG: hypothetical protein ACFFCQ_00500 [Promethearchaeota archaeon]
MDDVVDPTREESLGGGPIFSRERGRELLSEVTTEEKSVESFGGLKEVGIVMKNVESSPRIPVKIMNKIKQVKKTDNLRMSPPSEVLIVFRSALKHPQR